MNLNSVRFGKHPLLDQPTLPPPPLKFLNVCLTPPKHVNEQVQLCWKPFENQYFSTEILAGSWSVQGWQSVPMKWPELSPFATWKSCWPVKNNQGGYFSNVLTRAFSGKSMVTRSTILWQGVQLSNWTLECPFRFKGESLKQNIWIGLMEIMDIQGWGHVV